MQYTSPLSFIEIPAGQNEISSRDISLTKRKLLAEFELHNAATIVVNDNELTKNDVLNLFNSLEGSGDFQFHQLVATDKILSYFLQHNQIEYREKFALKKNEVGAEFINWISPFFKHSFIECSRAAFDQQDIYSFSTLLKNEFFLTHADEELVWNWLHQQVALLINEMSGITKENYVSQSASLKKLTSSELVGMLNALPQDQFHEEVNAYGFKMLNLSVDIFNSGRKSLGQSILETALMLTVSDELRDTMNDRKTKMDAMQDAAGTAGGSSTGGGGISGGQVLSIIIFIITLFRILSRCH